MYYSKYQALKDSNLRMAKALKQVQLLQKEMKVLVDRPPPTRKDLTYRRLGTRTEGTQEKEEI